MNGKNKTKSFNEGSNFKNLLHLMPSNQTFVKKNKVYISITFNGFNLGAVTFAIKRNALKSNDPLQILQKKVTSYVKCVTLSAFLLVRYE